MQKVSPINFNVSSLLNPKVTYKVRLTQIRYRASKVAFPQEKYLKIPDSVDLLENPKAAGSASSVQVSAIIEVHSRDTDTCITTKFQRHTTLWVDCLNLQT
jgi:hypothetical protein